MTVYVAVDFHAREQTVSYGDLAEGEIQRTKLRHQHDDVRAFYEHFTGEVIVAIEASGYSAWFEQMLTEVGHTIWWVIAQLQALTLSPVLAHQRDEWLQLMALIESAHCCGEEALQQRRAMRPWLCCKPIPG